MATNEELKTLLVIGNGFDLAHGLQTRYTDFLNFINLRIETHIKEIVDKQMVKRDALFDNAKPSEAIQITEENKKFRKQLRENYFREVDNNRENFDLLHKRREEIQKKIFKTSLTFENILDYVFNFGNIWIGHFNKCRENKFNRIGEDWIDFEKEIESVIKNIEKLISGEKINEPPDQFILQDYDRISPQLIIQKYIPIMDWDLKILTLLLEGYLIDEEKIFQSKQVPFFKNLNPEAVISYNYTHIFQKLYDAETKTPVHFIHGELGKHNLVLGIGETLPDDQKDNLTVCASFKKFFQIIKCRLGNQYKNITKFKGEYIFWEVIIYGHSLDSTDIDSLRWLMSNSTTQNPALHPIKKISIYYYDENSYNQQIANAIQIIGKDELIEAVNSERIVFLPIQ